MARSDREERKSGRRKRRLLPWLAALFGITNIAMIALIAASDSTAAPTLIARVDNVHVVADIEGLAIVPRGALVASSQNNNTCAAYDLETSAFVRRFQIVGAESIDGVSDTDGVEFAPGDFGPPFRAGVFIVQDGDNSPENQNFKLVSGRDLKRLLGLR
ncbi:MAG TPA: phytase [Caulobacterales bacterium]|nr:phytase [Caulobacterales bacterium]